MDYFDKNFADYDSSDHSDLPEGFEWENMKEGIYERMDGKKPIATYKKYWPFFLLLLMVGCGTGSWFALNNTDEKLNEEMLSAFTEDLLVNSDVDFDADVDADIDVDTDNKFVSIESDNSKTTGYERTIINEQTITSKNPNIASVEQPSGIGYLKNNPSSNNTLTVEEFTQTNKTVLAIDAEAENVSGEQVIDSAQLFTYEKSEIEKTNLSSMTLELFDTENQKRSPKKNYSEVYKPKVKFSKQLHLSLATGIANWTTQISDNENRNHVSGFPGYSINPSVQLFVRPKHALQVDYEFTALEELFDYDGSRPISVTKENVVVEELVSSLTGKVLSSERKNVTVPGTRSYREVKYNQYQFHTLSVGYHFASTKKKRSSFGFYTGVSYLVQMKQQGKRLNEELDVVPFDNENKVFDNQQFGLRFGVNYDYALGKNTALFSQLVATQYLTNWEVGMSNTKTRPLFYGLQIGIRQKL